MDYSKLESYSPKQLKIEVTKLKIKGRSSLKTKDDYIKALKDFNKNESLDDDDTSKVTKNTKVIKSSSDENLDIPMFNYKVNMSFINHIKLLTEIPNDLINTLGNLLINDVEIKMSCKKLVDLLKKFEVPITATFLENIFNHLYPYQTFLKTKKELEEYDMSLSRDGKIIDWHIEGRYFPRKKTEFTSPDFDVKYINALFFDPTSAKYKYYKLVIKQSTIKQAGMGVYAEENIPSGLHGFYNGVYTTLPNELYTWSIYKFDLINGEILDDAPETKWNIDAFDIRTSNWTRYVNCGMFNRKNNMFAIQLFHIILYKTLKNVKKGDELFIDYGEGYRTAHLKIDDKKY